MMTMMISNCSSMMPSYIMIADSTELKTTNKISNVIILVLKINPMTDCTEIFIEIIFNSS